jgi:hypothetical protein
MQLLGWKEQGKEEDHIRDGGTKMKRIKSNGNKKQAGNGQRLLGMEEDCSGCQVL